MVNSGSSIWMLRQPASARSRKLWRSSLPISAIMRGDVAVVLVVGHLCQHVRAGHGDLDRLVGQRRHHPEFVDQAKIDRVGDGAPAGRGRMEDVGIVRRDRLGLGAALERRDLLPEEVQHGVGRGVSIVGAAVHLAAGHDVYAGQLLVEDGRLRRAELGVGHRGHAKAGRRRPAGRATHTSRARCERRSRSWRISDSMASLEHDR